ncbi:MAG: UDP-N-acetylmuramoyl-L-alanyl-D-glutamate--2,6-diaminopimelate ligase [Pseudomonadota bacterium]
MRLGTLIEGFESRGSHCDPDITGLSLDSRLVTPGDCFLALKGHRTDGASFIEEALDRGAAAILHGVVDTSEKLAVENCLYVDELNRHLGVIADRFFDSPSKRLNVCAITGTNGKTTVAHLLAHLFEQLGQAWGYIGTLGAGQARALNQTSNTTPDVISINRLLRSFSDSGCSGAALEASSHGLAQGRLDALQIAVAVLTNLQTDHLDYHGDAERYAEAKARLFTKAQLRVAVLNADEAFSARLEGQISRDVIIWRYGRSKNLQPAARFVVGQVVASSASGTEILIRHDQGQAVLRTNLIGEFNVDNLLATLTAALALGVELDQACQALASVGAPPGRLELVSDRDCSFQVYVDYAHTPDALHAALRCLRGICEGELRCVFGCGGDRDTEKRPLMGAAVAHHADRIFLTADNPRGESLEAINVAVLRGIGAHAQVDVIDDRRVAIAAAIDGCGPGDIVLIAGKGHEGQQIFADSAVPFSDRAVAQELLSRQLH